MWNSVNRLTGFNARTDTFVASFNPVNASVDSLRHLGQQLVTTGDSSGVQDGQTLTVNSQSVGSYHYRVISGNHTISAFSNNDYFSTIADSDWEVLCVDGNLTINSGQTVQPTARKLGFVVYVTGDLAVSGGISMSARGADHSAATGSNVTAVAVRIADGTYSAVTDPEIPAAGGAGGASQGSNGAGNVGSGGSGGGTGGGGSGASAGAASGAGGSGTAFSGGTGGGAAGSAGNPGSDGAAAGGPGGDSGQVTGNLGGGAGNPGGAGIGTGVAGDDGTGGILVIICLGTLSGAGVISADGAAGGDSGGRAGGGSGGGSVTVLYGTDSSSITPTANGGAGGDGSLDGGAGGAGTARKLAIP